VEATTTYILAQPIFPWPEIVVAFVLGFGFAKLFTP
jgi:hypothetical protein